MSDTPARLTGALADRYRVERELGQGGMATVYLAHDLRHDRDVAIKVLHPDLGAALGSERFLSEIRTTARLQHPHILPLLDSGEADGLLYYVMPLVTGETLRARLERERQLPIDAAVLVAREVADALGYAHGLGVIHRDIKPENILLQGGHALVADFGIALAVQQAGGQRMTQTGLSLGTPQYMSPEQAMGERAIDARSDIYALGAVAYEMLVGEPPFTGPTVQAIVARLITETPRGLAAQRKAVPEQVEYTVLRALEKLPADRFATATEFAMALGGGTTASPPGRRASTAASRMSPPNRTVLILGAVTAVAVAAAAVAWMRPRAPVEVTRHRVMLWRHAQGDFLSPGLLQVNTQVAIAPDGSRIVFTDSVGGTTRLFLKRRSESEPVALAGTDDALSPFFSPDGAWIGFFTVDGALKKIPADGGGSVTIAQGNTETYYTAAWLEDNTIVFTAGGTGGLGRVSANGGAVSVVSPDTLRRSNMALLAPLPRSRGVLVTTCPGNCSTGSAVGVIDLAADSIKELVPGAAGAWYSPTGHLLYTGRGGGLYAASFDPDRLELGKGAIPIIADVAPVRFAMSASGTALYSLNPAKNASAELHWVSRDGSSTPVDTSWRGEFEYPALAPDGQTIAVSVRERTTDLWIRRADGTRRKMTQTGTINWRPFWSADGQSLLFVSNMVGRGGRDDVDLYRVSAEASSPPQLVHRHRWGVWEGEISTDGQWLVIRSDEADNAISIRARRFRGDTALQPVVVGNGTNIQLSLSPDGRSLAYVSNPTGAREVYVVPFPGGGISQLVSRGGGTEPRWSRSGRELFYKSGGQLVSVAVTPGAVLAFGAPRSLFPLAGYRGARNRQQYDVAPGDQRFLMIRNLVSSSASEAVYVENWLTELRAKLSSTTTGRQ